MRLRREQQWKEETSQVDRAGEDGRAVRAISFESCDAEREMLRRRNESNSNDSTNSRFNEGVRWGHRSQGCPAVVEKGSRL